MLNYKKTSADRSGSLFAIVDERISRGCEEGLKKEGFLIIKLPKDERLGEAVASHTDMLIFRHGTTFIGSKAYFERNPELFSTLKKTIPSFEFRLSEEEISSSYPRDAIFNAIVFNDKIFLKKDTVSREIISYAEEMGLKPVNVRQGYPACTALKVTDSFAITADAGMEEALRAEGIDVLKIKNSEKILLPPYRYGFIGGASSVFEKKVYFLGNLKSLPFFSVIEEKLAEVGYQAVSLDPESDSLFDLGGIILINTESKGKNTSPKNPKSE